MVVRFQARSRVLFFQNVETASEAHPAIHSVVIRNSLPDQKLARTLRGPVNPVTLRLRMSGAITPLPYIPPRSEQTQFSFLLFIISRVYTMVAQRRPTFIS